MGRPHTHTDPPVPRGSAAAALALKSGMAVMVQRGAR